MSYLEISHNRNRARTAGEYKNNNNHGITTPKGRIINIVNGKATLLPQLHHHGGKSKLKRLENIRGNKEDWLAQLEPLKHAALKKPCPNDTRPRTIPGLPKNVHFSNVVDRFRPGEPASQILLTNRTEPAAAAAEVTRTEEEEQQCIITAKNNSNATEGQYRWHSAKKSYVSKEQDEEEDFRRRNKLRGNLQEEECEECDLEFMNTSFVYSDEDDDSLSVNEFSLDDATVVKAGKSSSTVMRMTVEKPCSVEDDSYQFTTLTALMKSLFPLGAGLFGNTASNSNEPSILSTVTTAGERIFRGVAEAIFCDGGGPFSQEQQQRAVFTYNDYNITTSGNDLLLNSVFLDGGKNQRVRVFVEMKEEPVNSVSTAAAQKSTLHVSVTSSSWTLASRNRKGFEKGSIEIRAPASVQLTGVSVQGPFQGILCINVP